MAGKIVNDAAPICLKDTVKDGKQTDEALNENKARKSTPRRIYFAEALTQPLSPGCCNCRCMRDPGQRDDAEENTNSNWKESTSPFKDQNETPWLDWEDDGETDSSGEFDYTANKQKNSQVNNNNIYEGTHAELTEFVCGNMVGTHKTKMVCIGLDHKKDSEAERYILQDHGNPVLTEKCNTILKRFWCEQQAHGLTNLCYFISETEKVCFDALGMPCHQIYGFLDRGLNSIPHAWVRLGAKKQLIDITYYREKSFTLPNRYWIPLKEYQDGARPKTMKEDNDFKKAFHWKYMYLCTLVPERRSFLRCIFKFMKEEMQVNVPDLIKAAVTFCWNCDKSLGRDRLRCPECEGAFFCNEKCREEETHRQPSHVEICADYKKRVAAGELKIAKPPVESMEQLIG